MTRKSLTMTAVSLVLLLSAVEFGAGLWSRPLRMDNRLYFAIAERAASGVPPHVSTPDVKNQLAPLLDAGAMRIGRAVGLDDVHAGRLGLLAIFLAGCLGVWASVLALGAAPMSALLSVLSVACFSGTVGHVAVGFNPKIPLFAFLAWLPFLLGTSRFVAAGAAAAAAMSCWQPAALAFAAVLGGASFGRPRLASLAACLGGGIVVVAAYEGWFWSQGALAAQLFQAWVLPLGSVHEEVNWIDGLTFVAFGSGQGLDRFGIPFFCFAAVAAGALLSALGVAIPRAGRRPAPLPAVIGLVGGGVLACGFTAYEHQAEPDRLLLCAYFAVAIGMFVDRLLVALAQWGNPAAAWRVEGAIAILVLFTISKGDKSAHRGDGDLQHQRRAANVVAMYAESYGSVWSWGCDHLLSLAHLPNAHPYSHAWDDLDRLVAQESFSPEVRGELPALILRRGHIPGGTRILDRYDEVLLPALSSDRAHLLVRKGLREGISTASEPVRRKEPRGRGRGRQRGLEQRRT